MKKGSPKALTRRCYATRRRTPAFRRQPVVGAAPHDRVDEHIEPDDDPTIRLKSRKASRDKLAISGMEKIEAYDQMENIADLAMPPDQN